MSLWLIQLALNAHPGLCPGDIQIKETTCEERNSNQLERNSNQLERRGTQTSWREAAVSDLRSFQSHC